MAGRISNDVVNKYVDEILANDKINIKSLPDSIERLIYATTVRVTLNAVYRWLSVLHGMKLFGHHLELVREISPQHGAADLDFEHNTGFVHDEALEEMTERLLQNTHVNQWWIPDIVERQVQHTHATCHVRAALRPHPPPHAAPCSLHHAFGTLPTTHKAWSRSTRTTGLL